MLAFSWFIIITHVLLLDREHIDKTVSPRITPVTFYRYGASVDIDDAEVIGFGVIVHVPGDFDGRVDCAAAAAGSAGAIEKLNDIVLPCGGQRGGLGIRQDTAVNSPAGKKMGMSAGIEVELVGVKESPEPGKGLAYSGWFGRVVVDIIIGCMNEKKFMGCLGLGYLCSQP